MCTQVVLKKCLYYPVTRKREAYLTCQPRADPGVRTQIFLSNPEETPVTLSAQSWVFFEMEIPSKQITLLYKLHSITNQASGGSYYSQKRSAFEDHNLQEVSRSLHCSKVRRSSLGEPCVKWKLYRTASAATHCCRDQELLEEGYGYPQCRLLFSAQKNGQNRSLYKWWTATNQFG